MLDPARGRELATTDRRMEQRHGTGRSALWVVAVLTAGWRPGIALRESDRRPRRVPSSGLLGWLDHNRSLAACPAHLRPAERPGKNVRGWSQRRGSQPWSLPRTNGGALRAVVWPPHHELRARAPLPGWLRRSGSLRARS